MQNTRKNAFLMPPTRAANAPEGSRKAFGFAEGDIKKASTDAEEKPAGAPSADGKARAPEREEVEEEHGGNWEPDWDAWLLAKAQRRGVLRTLESEVTEQASAMGGLGRRPHDFGRAVD
ncbi:hypothetical protein AVME950_02415 [Acidovorax sp. SUPP950]|uniref:hypothetical protein n=1 Tax=Acidovorax sp. SUPP950 TaxID=511901 RepID=UPI0023BFE654|nr:hypothetical protein [Acidovorax sp. SUPP950]GKS73701.1 hypothetical protein AVME950_02415 [Acidovorax sp. SUPP950]